MKRIVLVFAATGLLLAGCSEDGGSEVAGTATSTRTSAAQSPVASSSPAPSTGVVEATSLQERAQSLVQLTSAGAPLDEISVYLEPSCTDYLRQFESQMGPSPSTVTSVDEATGAVTTLTTASGTSDTMIWTKASGTWLMTCP